MPQKEEETPQLNKVWKLFFKEGNAVKKNGNASKQRGNISTK